MLSKRLSFMLLMVPLACPASFAREDDPGTDAKVPDPCEQHYTPWQRHASGKYYFCKYFFRPQPGASRKVQIVVWFPEEPQNQFTYFFNPDDEVYWCRAVNHYHDDHRQGSDRWHVLKKGKSKYIKQIVAWPKEFSMPDVPGSKGLAKIKAPPKPPQLESTTSSDS